MPRSRNKSPTIAVKANPKLWEKVKDEIMASSKGGLPGKWSARKSQLAVKLYKERGGKYKGSRSRSNSLTKWSNEQWGYVGSPKRSRYLPKVVRKHLSRGARSGESRRKGSKRGEWIPYGEETVKLMHKYNIIN
jgi:hypothetical protein